MTTENEIRVKLPLKLHQKWSAAAELRGLSLTAFVVSTVSGTLLSTGELTPDPVTTVTKAPKETWDDEEDDYEPS